MEKCSAMIYTWVYREQQCFKARICIAAHAKWNTQKN